MSWKSSDQKQQEIIDMTDRSAAEIHIGGKIPGSVAQALCTVITKSGASLEWGGGWCRLNTPDELLLARSADTGGPLLLKLYDDEARGGQFETLEVFLQKHGIPYCRWSEGKYEYDAEIVTFHPRCGQLSWPTNHDQHPIVLVSQLAPIADALAKLLAEIHGSEVPSAKLRRKLQRIRGKLQKCLPPIVPALESFELIGR
jgi:hypothetical protein